MICYEHPLTERVRKFLRLEDLFLRIRHFMEAETRHDHHIALLTLFEIIEMADRGDIRSDLLNELERQRQALMVLQNNEEISNEALTRTLIEIEQSIAGLSAMTGKLGYSLKENSWLTALKGRAAISGGACSFDLPFYHYWLQQRTEARRGEIENWLSLVRPIFSGVSILLRILRAKGMEEYCETGNGVYQLMLAGRQAHLIRLGLSEEAQYLPEISANKHAINIRFLLVQNDCKPAEAVSGNVYFTLLLCQL